MKQKRILVVIILLTILLNFNLDVSSQDIIDTNLCRAYLTMDLQSGQILYSYNADMRIFPASTTKMMTALVAVENAPLDKIFTATKNSTRYLEEDSGELDLLPDEQMDFYSLLHGLMIRSYNDVALVIAENTAGTEEDFIDMMNERAKELGALNTHFTNPHGLHNEEHYTTAYDLAIIAQHALSNFIISSICAKKEFTLPPTNLRSEFKDTLKNTNHILGGNPGYDFTVLAGKTGYTSKAQNLLVIKSSDYTGREMITVLAGVKEREKVGELVLDLTKASYDDFSVQTIAKAGQIIAKHEGIDIANTEYIEYLMNNDKQSWNLTTDIQYYNYVDFNNVKIADIVGLVSYYNNNVLIAQSLLSAASSNKVIEKDPDSNMNTQTPTGPDNTINEPNNTTYEQNSGTNYLFIGSLTISVILLFLIIILFVNIVKVKRTKIAHSNKNLYDNDSEDNNDSDELDSEMDSEQD